MNDRGVAHPTCATPGAFIVAPVLLPSVPTLTFFGVAGLSGRAVLVARALDTFVLTQQARGFFVVGTVGIAGAFDALVVDAGGVTLAAIRCSKALDAACGRAIAARVVFTAIVV